MDAKVDWDALVAAEAPTFDHLRPALMKRGFTVAAYISEHMRHEMHREYHSSCAECVATLPQRPDDFPSVLGRAMRGER